MVAIVDILVLVPSHHSPTVSDVNLEGTGRIDDLSTTAKFNKTQPLRIIHGMYLLKRETQYMYLYLCYWSCLENAFVMNDIFITASLITSSMIFLLRWNIMYDRSSILLRNLPYISCLFKFTKSTASFTICAAPVVLQGFHHCEQCEFSCHLESIVGIFWKNKQTNKQTNKTKHIMGLNLIITVPADDPAPSGADPSADTVLIIKFGLFLSGFIWIAMISHIVDRVPSL